MSNVSKKKLTAPRAASLRSAAVKTVVKRPKASAAAMRSVASLQNGLLGHGRLGQTADIVDGEDAPTERQMEIYTFIRDKIHSRGYGPTVREIGTAFKIRSPNGVVCHLKALHKKGLIVRVAMRSRSVLIPNYKKWARRKYV